MNKQGILRTILFAGIAVVMLGGLFFGLNKLDQKIGVVEVDEDDEYDYEDDNEIVLDGEIYTQDHRVKSYLFMGTDGSGNEEEKGPEYLGSMADFLLLLVVDEDEKKFGYIEINRDTITDVPMMDTSGNVSAYMPLQICCAHYYGGNKRQSCRNTVDAVSAFLGNVPINGYYSISMKDIAVINKAVGGVTVTLDEDLTDIDPTYTKGAVIDIKDNQAEKFVRSRMDVQDGENTSRMRRQKLYMDGLMAKIQSLGDQDPEAVIKAFEQIDKIAISDINMNVISKIVNNKAEYTDMGTLQITGTKDILVGVTDNLEHAAFYADEASVKEAVLALYPLKATGEKVEDDEDYDDEEYTDDYDDSDIEESEEAYEEDEISDDDEDWDEEDSEDDESEEESDEE